MTLFVFAAAPSAARAAPAPTVVAISADGDPNRGDVAVSLYGTKLTSVKTVTLKALPDGAEVPLTILSKAKDRIVVEIAPDLGPGTYRFTLSPKRGDPVTADYVIPGGNVLLGTLTTDVASNAITLGYDFEPGGGTVLTGEVRSKTMDGAQLRFTRAGTGDFTDIGQDGSGGFVVELTDQPALVVQANGLVRTGVQNGTSRFTVNGPIFGPAPTVDIRSHPDDTTYLSISDAEQALVFRVAEFGFDLLVGDAFKPGGGSFGVASDLRLKKDVVPLAGALDTLLALRSVSYEYKDPAAIRELPGRHVGFIAQEVEKVFPSWVGERENGMKFVAPKGFEALAVAALRDLRTEKDAQLRTLSDENAALRRRIAELESKTVSQDARLAAIEKALEKSAPSLSVR